jgi:hypothetical protein
MNRILRTWQLRFDRLPKRPDLLHETLCIRSLAVDSATLLPEWLKFLACATHNGRLTLVSRTVQMLKAAATTRSK